ncbi:hypothetical protein QEG73_11055 [Chitinophagaceae bacterium 26-R-25]|nr:hypothetical protein [Chitinophagaceae bacterium 26-R-25]
MITALAICGIQAFAAIGIGGGGKTKEKSIGIDFTPISIANSFTLKGNFSYRGGKIMSEERIAPNVISFNSIVTYQQGNTTYIMPYKSSVTLAPATNSSLQMLNLKVKIH